MSCTGRIGAAIIASGLLTMCASPSLDGHVPRRAADDGGPVKVQSLENDLAALGLSEESRTDSAADWTDALSIEQVANTLDSRDYGFEDVEGVDPCQRVGADPEACRDVSAALGSRLDVDRKDGEPSALSELQAITPDVVDPQSFDPIATADELGRLQLPQSQAAQSLGFQLLQPPAPVPEPEETPEDATGGLPPLPLDVIVTQQPAGGS